MKKLLMMAVLSATWLAAQINVVWQFDATKWPVTNPPMTRTFTLERTPAATGTACTSLAGATTWTQVTATIPGNALLYLDAGAMPLTSNCWRLKSVATWSATATVPAGTKDSTWSYTPNAVTVTPSIPPPTGVDAQVPQTVADVRIDMNGKTVATLRLAVPPQQAPVVARGLTWSPNLDGWAFDTVPPGQVAETLRCGVNLACEGSMPVKPEKEVRP